MERLSRGDDDAGPAYWPTTLYRQAAGSRQVARKRRVVRISLFFLSVSLHVQCSSVFIWRACMNYIYV